MRKKDAEIVEHLEDIGIVKDVGKLIKGYAGRPVIKQNKNLFIKN